MQPARVVLYVATIGAVALTVRGVVVSSVPTWVAVIALFAYLCLIGAGVALPQLEMFVDVVTRGPAGAHGVALTFDDGPHPDHTPAILRMLEKAKISATFFVIGRKAEAHPDIVRAIAAKGHAIGIHGHEHDRLFSMRTPRTVHRDLERAIATVEAITGERPALFRPPIGHTNPRIAKVVEALDLTVVGWSVRSLDGVRSARAERVARRVIDRLDDGAIVLLHDAAERDDYEPAAVRALPDILDAMRHRGLPGVRVDTWLES